LRDEIVARRERAVVGYAFSGELSSQAHMPVILFAAEGAIRMSNLL
jgi:hypothetical protein